MSFNITVMYHARLWGQVRVSSGRRNAGKRREPVIARRPLLACHVYQARSIAEAVIRLRTSSKTRNPGSAPPRVSAIILSYNLVIDEILLLVKSRFCEVLYRMTDCCVA